MEKKKILICLIIAILIISIFMPCILANSTDIDKVDNNEEIIFFSDNEYVDEKEIIDVDTISENIEDLKNSNNIIPIEITEYDEILNIKKLVKILILII